MQMRLLIQFGESKVVVPVPARSTVAEACSEVERTVGSPIRTLALTNEFELRVEDRIADVHQDEIL